MLIAMAVHSTQENGRLDYTLRTLFSLENTVDFDKHRLVIVDNGSDEETQKALDEWGQMHPCELIRFDENRGTAVAINAAWKMRAPWEHAVKMDDDVVIHEYGWTDLMEKVFEKDSSIGICGLKRKDLEEWPLNQHEWFKSEFIALPHTRGERWLAVEKVFHVMGTCQAYSSALLEKIGFLYQMQDIGNLYGFDDGLAAVRASVAGFKCVFIPWIEIEHIDPGNSEHTTWKQQNAKKWMNVFNGVKAEYISGERDVYYDGP